MVRLLSAWRDQLSLAGGDLDGFVRLSCLLKCCPSPKLLQVFIAAVKPEKFRELNARQRQHCIQLRDDRC